MFAGTDAADKDQARIFRMEADSMHNFLIRNGYDVRRVVASVRPPHHLAPLFYALICDI